MGLRSFLTALFLLSFFGLHLFFLTACELGEDDKQAIRDGLLVDPNYPPPASPPPRDVIGEIPPEQICEIKRFFQPEAIITRNIDILFVADTSGSLDEERSVIANGIDSFVAELPAEVDYRIGVLLGHGSNSQWSGHLYKSRQEPYVLDSQQMTLDQIRTALHDKLYRDVEDLETDGGEAGLYSLTQLLKPDNLAIARAQGFFRENAALAIVFIADENDICARYPEGVTPIVDRDRRETKSFTKYCSNVTPESTLAAIRGLQGERPLLVSGILYDNLETVPNRGEEELGYGYLETIEQAQGITIDLATGDYDLGLAEIGRLATVKLNLITEYRILRNYVDPTSILVFIDGTTSTHAYDEPNQIVHLLDPGWAKSTVDIKYCWYKEPPSSQGSDDGDSGGPGDDDPDQLPGEPEQ